MGDPRLESASRLLADLAVLCNLQETPIGTRAVLREARDMLKELLRLGSTGGEYSGRRVYKLVHGLTERMKLEEQSGVKATMRRTIKALAGAADAVDEANAVVARQ